MKPRWSRPFVIKRIMSKGVTRIRDLDGEEMLCPNKHGQAPKMLPLKRTRKQKNIYLKKKNR